MKNGNFHALAQFFLDVKALRCLDVFEIDTAERRLQGRNDFDKFVGVCFGELDIEYIDTCEFFK